MEKGVEFSLNEKLLLLIQFIKFVIYMYNTFFVLFQLLCETI